MLGASASYMKVLKKQELEARKDFLLKQATFAAGQLRFLGPSGEVMVTTRRGAVPHNYEPWPSEPSFEEWIGTQKQARYLGLAAPGCIVSSAKRHDAKLSHIKDDGSAK